VLGILSGLVLAFWGMLYILNIITDFYEKKICKQKSKERN